MNEETTRACSVVGHVVDNLKARGIAVETADTVQEFIEQAETNQYNSYLIVDNRFYRELFKQRARKRKVDHDGVGISCGCAGK